MSAGWIVAAMLAALWLVDQWRIFRLTGDLAEWKARADERARQRDRYRDERRESR